jgi:uncharacterized membrane protein YccC
MALRQFSPASPGASRDAWQPAPRMSERTALRAALPPLLAGLRLWVAVCLALSVAFTLELPNPFWAGTSAAVVWQPTVGASLRKGWYRMIGTIIGAVAIVILTALFPQSRAGFLIGLALWGGLCGFVASLLRNFASYAAALAGFTAAIIGGDQLGAVGGANGLAFPLAVTRATEISIGIVCAGAVIAGTSFGGARRRLALQLGGLAAETAAGLLDALRLPGSAQGGSRAVRRDLLRRVGGLDAVIDQALGEAPALRFRPRALQAAVDGLFAALSTWRTVANHLERRPEAQSPHAVAAVLDCLPPELRDARRDAAAWAREGMVLRRACAQAVRRLVALPADTPGQRLLADRVAIGLVGLRATAGGLAVLADPVWPAPGPRFARLRVPDMLPPLINGLRVVLTVAAVELLWIATAWPSGPTALMFAFITVVLFSPREDAAYGGARGFMVGNAGPCVLAGVIGFAVLPRQTTFLGFCLAIGLVLVPAGALAARWWGVAAFFALAANFTPLLGPANTMSFDVEQFYQRALAILVGIGCALLGLALLPPLSPLLRARRLLTLTLRDLRRLAAGRWLASGAGWEGHVYARLSAMPDGADPQQRAQLAAAVAVGAEITRLRRIGGRFGVGGDLDAALDAVAQGDSAAAIARLGRVDAGLATAVGAAMLRLRARATVAALAEALAQHAAYFDADVAA